MGVPLFCGAVFQVVSVLQSGHCCCFSTNANPCNFARREVNYLPKWNDIGNSEVEGVSKLLLAHTFCELSGAHRFWIPTVQLKKVSVWQTCQNPDVCGAVSWVGVWGQEECVFAKDLNLLERKAVTPTLNTTHSQMHAYTLYDLKGSTKSLWGIKL